MTADKIIEVCNLYDKALRPYGLQNPRLTHVLNRMIPYVREFARDNRLEKAFRWLGFMQGVLWAEGVYSIEQLKDHNRPDKPSTKCISE